VHGDLRLSNIYVRRSIVDDGTAATDADFMFVNFDLAGHDRATQYPAWLSTKAVHMNGVRPLQSITQDVDRAALHASLCGAKLAG
jgi:hypothetical protein